MDDRLISLNMILNAIDANNGILYDNPTLVASLKKMLSELPPAQPGWISVTERLPTENNSYLVWMPFAPEGHHITVAEWCGSYWNIKTPITAWMPLPKPWEGYES